jgi:hypothetical protein
MSVIGSDSKGVSSKAAVAPAGTGADREPSAALRVAGVAARSIFLLAVIVVTAHVAMPQTMGRIGQASTSPGDVVRAGLGLAACLWVAWQLFKFRRSAHDHKTWLILGPALTALLVACAIAWW